VSFDAVVVGGGGVCVVVVGSFIFARAWWSISIVRGDYSMVVVFGY